MICPIRCRQRNCFVRWKTSSSTWNSTASATEKTAVFAASLAFWLVMGPANTLGTALSFTHLAQPARDFGRVRLWGTIGWVAAGWVDVPLNDWGIGPDQPYVVHDLLTDERFTWRGNANWVRLDPNMQPAHILHIEVPRY